MTHEEKLLFSFLHLTHPCHYVGWFVTKGIDALIDFILLMKSSDHASHLNGVILKEEWTFQIVLNMYPFEMKIGKRKENGVAPPHPSIFISISISI